jgi:outer membrane lipoprotein-sorting protein
MKFKHVLIAVLSFTLLGAKAQTAEEIIDKYFENTGGYTNWAKVESMKLDAKVNQQGLEIPLVMLQLKDGRQATTITFQGKEIKQGVYDGTSLWSHNFMNMKAEKSDAEATENFKANLGSDFPTAFFDYKKRGYKVEFLGKETIEGTETFKIKLTKNPTKVDGQPKDNIEFYFFDMENYVPLMVESEITQGQAKGMIGQTKLSDYQEVNGLIVPFSMSQGVKGGGSQPITITKIEINPKVDVAVFAFPADN